MENKFYGLNIILQIVLLVIPFVNWIVEMIVRWSTFIHKSSALNLVGALIVTFFGAFYILEILDIIWICLNKKLFLVE